MQITTRASEFIYQKLFRPILSFLNQGVTPEKLALTIALGVIIGMLPVFGIASVLCVVLALSLRLNMAAIQLTHYIAAPLQILLLVPFIRLGGMVFNVAPMPFSFTQLYRMFSADIMATFKSLWFTFFLGFTGWMLVSIPVAFLLYFITLPIFKKMSPSTASPVIQA